MPVFIVIKYLIVPILVLQTAYSELNISVYNLSSGQGKFACISLCSTGHGMRYGLNNTTKVILLTAVVRDIGFENVTYRSLSES